MTRAWLAQYRHYFSGLLMDDAQLLDHRYCPPVSLEELFRTKIRPAVYFLQKCTVDTGTFRGPPCYIHPSEKAQLCLLMIRLVGTVRVLGRCRILQRTIPLHPSLPFRELLSPAEVAAKEEHFRIPGCSANMFIIILSLLARLADPAVDDQLVSIIRPCVTEMHLDAIADYRIVGGETEYHEYWKDGTLRPLYHEIDLIPEESSSYAFFLRDEFLNCEYPSVEEITAYAKHPFMAKLSCDILEPMNHYLSCIRAEFCPPEESKVPWKKRAMRVRIRDYLDHAERLSDMVIEYRELAEGHRIPVPRVSFLREVMHAESVYGFQGDEDMILRSILRGKLASLHRYSDKLRERAYNQIYWSAGRAKSGTRDGSRAYSRKSSVSEDGEMTEKFIRSSPHLLWLMSYYPNNSPRSISRLVDIGPLLRSELQFFAASVIEIDEFQDSQFAHLRYVTEHLRPFGAVIDACIPSSVSSSSNMPAGRVAELAPFVMRYMERVALLYSMALRYSEDNLTSPFLDTRVRWSVTLANKFDMFVGRPNYGFSPETREVFVAWIALAGELAHANQDANSILDVPLSAEYLSLPVVPSWNRDRIEELLKREQVDPFIGEECFLQDQIMASQGLAHAIQKASDLETEGFSGHPSGRYRV
ncbi:hypothetical protein DFH06DRAFT_1119183 [Mycena polygramma]|nr:hypothetical protein DFH06DRAFT_1119183 [Mycena polygramma]